MPCGCGGICLLPFPTAQQRPAQQAHLEKQERQRLPEPVGVEDTVTQVEKRLRKAEGLDTLQHTDTAFACCLALPQLSVCSSHTTPLFFRPKLLTCWALATETMTNPQRSALFPVQVLTTSDHIRNRGQDSLGHHGVSLCPF